MRSEHIADLLALRSIDGQRAAMIRMGRDSAVGMTRAELMERAGRLARGLREDGLGQGDRVAMLAPNSTDWVVSALGVINAGGVLVPLDTQMPDDDLRHVISDSAPRVIFTTTALRKRLEDVQDCPPLRLLDADPGTSRSWADLLADKPALPEPGENAGQETAVIFYTSGTTGPPKGVPLTHRNLCSNVEALLRVELADHRDRVMLPLPFHHVYPFTVGILVPLTLGAPIVMPHSLVGPQIIRALREGEATIILGVPRLYEALWTAIEDRVKHRGRMAGKVFSALLTLSVVARRRLGLRIGRRLFARLHSQMGPSLRLLVSGGGPLDPDLGRRLQALGWELAIGYGLSETAPILTFNPPERLKFGSVGMTLPGVDIRIDTSSSGHSGDSGDGRGEVLARGPNVFDGYLGLPDKTAQVLKDDGWFRTGDTGSMDADGYLYLHGRESSMIVLSEGENIDPERVEKVLQAADEIREAGVLDYDDRLAAVIVPEPDFLRQLDDEERDAGVKNAARGAARDLPTHHRPEKLRITLDPLPRTRLGKLRRHKLRALFKSLEEKGAGDAHPMEPVSPESMAPDDRQLLSDPAAASTWEYLAERYEDLRLTPDSSLAQDLDIDSLGWINLSLEVRERAGVELDESAIGRVETVRDLLREAASARAGTGEGAGEGSESFQEQLEQPDELLTQEQQETLQPRGKFQRWLGRGLLVLMRALARLLMRVEVSGQFPRDSPFLIAPRHLSFVDPLALAFVLSRKQLESLYWAGLTAYLFRTRAARTFSRIARVLPIDPGSAPRSSLALAAACLARGNTLIWFPEGRRSPDGRLQALRPGIGLVLAAQPVPVVPVGIEGTRKVLPPGRRLPRRGRVRLRIGEALAPDDYGREPREIVDNIHTRLEGLAEPEGEDTDE